MLSGGQEGAGLSDLSADDGVRTLPTFSASTMIFVAGDEIPSESPTLPDSIRETRHEQVFTELSRVCRVQNTSLVELAEDEP